MNKKKIFIYAEDDCGAVTDVFYELLSKSAELNDQLCRLEGTPAMVCAVAVGISDEETVRSLAESGVDHVYNIKHDKLNAYNPAVYSEAAAELCRAEKPYIFLFGSTVLGTEIAPSLGVKLSTGVSAHCVDIRFDEDGSFIQDVPAFGGKVIGEIVTPDTFPKIATVKPGIFRRTLLPSKNAKVQTFLPLLENTVTDGIEFKSVQVRQRDSIPVDQAEVIICGGFGMGCDENWKLLERLSGCFEKAAVGCTRPALDEQWVEEDSSMIGTSGKTVRPKLYIGAGISGAMHHICGINDSELIVNINKDENAEIFKVSDIKIVGDAVKILTALNERLVRG